MPALTLFNVFRKDFAEGAHAFGADTLKCVLSNTAPVIATNTVIGDITEITAENGYPAGGVTLDGVAVTQNGASAKVAITDEVFTASGGSVGPFVYFVVYNNTNNQLIGYYTRAEGAETLSDGESITLDFDAAAGVIVLGA